jgi:hypothetical protein
MNKVGLILYCNQFSILEEWADLETSMDPNKTRRLSLDFATKVGLSTPATLALLESGLHLRSQDDTVNRLLCLTAVAAASYGLDKAQALSWLRQERLEGLLTAAEVQFLERNEGNPQAFQAQIEGLWALAWALNFVPKLNFLTESDNRFVTLLPNLKVSQSSDEWRLKAKLRPVDDVVAACDLAYCLHWAIRQAEIDRREPPARLNSYVVVERRRALEWLLSSDSWDGVSLDT